MDLNMGKESSLGKMNRFIKEISNLEFFKGWALITSKIEIRHTEDSSKREKLKV